MKTKIVMFFFYNHFFKKNELCFKIAEILKLVARYFYLCDNFLTKSIVIDYYRLYRF